jgi:AraC-like DNA-binding protein
VPEPVRHAQRFALANLGRPLALADLARAAHVSPEHLTRLFRRVSGQTPMAWVWSRRDREGARLLAGSGLTAAQIADRLGYPTPFHFSRRIRRSTGRSPRHLRARAWGGR